VVLDNEGNARLVDCKPRVKETIDLIEQAGHKVIVFVPFRAPLVMLTAELERLFSVAMIHGDVPVGKRNTIFAAVPERQGAARARGRRRLHEPRADPHRGQHHHLVRPGVEQRHYTQANDRITRSGQVNAQHILHLVSCEAERRLYKRLQERARLQGLLLDLAKEAAL
jgi:hypothetical protein